MRVHKPKFELTESATKWSFVATVGAAWVALAGVLVLAGGLLLLARAQRPIDVQSAINSYTKSQFFAQNFLLTWAAGDPKDAEKLASMTALPGQPELNSNPFTVLFLNPTDVTATPAGQQSEWEWTFGATVILPQAGTSIRSYFRVTTLESGGTFKALKWPEPVNDTARNFTVGPYYTRGAEVGGPLGTSVKDFMNAYYTANNPGVLGRFVTANFTDTPIAASPYTSIEVTTILLANNSIDTSQAKPGATVSALVTAKAAASTTTFHTVSTVLRLSLSKNNQWLVDGFERPMHFGDVSYK
ncbi:MULTISPECIES: conjugal transfer protein [Mycolicibacter]|uniref:Uncharacterized protein n=1 Tax=Mycolicibacter longobardus TaxID=1108812 RepID=A0A1X1YBP3_9MYCO|nr:MULTISPECIES: conjugal transfer protein [Mycolicibacter]ORW08523.1 hypothetical protein AWC16_19180 [Mycolicibacter longobardus]RAV04366.1 hypothetical protein DQP56_00680 [Mycolicibacter senuensis]